MDTLLVIDSIAHMDTTIADSYSVFNAIITTDHDTNIDNRNNARDTATDTLNNLYSRRDDLNTALDFYTSYVNDLGLNYVINYAIELVVNELKYATNSVCCIAIYLDDTARNTITDDTNDNYNTMLVKMREADSVYDAAATAFMLVIENTN
jgi:hypothetical protein